MTPEQEQHLQGIQEDFCELVDAKYRKGQAEHGGNLLNKLPAEVLDMAIEEAIDQVVYLLTLREILNKE